MFAAVLLILFSISCASATNSSTNTTDEQITLVSEPPQAAGDSLAVTATNNRYVNINTGNDSWDGTSANHTSGTVGPYKTINKAVNSLNSNNGGTLYIANGIYTISGQLNIQYNSNIYGTNRDSTIIDGNFTNRVFLINENVIATIANLTIRNGGFPQSDHKDPGQDGAGVYNKGILIIDNCNIFNNTAGHGGSAHLLGDAGRGGYGGGIFNSNTGNLTIKNSIIHDNSAGKGGSANESNPGGHGGHGGAIFNQYLLSILNCEIYNNKAGLGGNPKEDFYPGGSGGYGGAIFNDAAGTATITSTNIHNNTAGLGIFGGHGGAIFNNGVLTLTGCTIDSNQAVFKATAENKEGGDGGGIYNQKTLYIINCQITNNSAADGPKGDDARWQKNLYYYVGGNGHIGGSGGGIYNSGTLTLTGSNISNNRAGNGGNGGKGTWCYETITDNGVDIDIPGTLDPGSGGNGGNGGGIYNSGNILSITNCTINNNTAGKGGDGGLYADDYNLSLGLKVNPGKAGIGGSGGGIYSLGSISEIKNTSINYNQAGNGGNGNAVSRYPAENGNTGGNGGGLVLFKSVVITNCQISNNRAGNGGNGGNTFTSSGNNPSTKPGLGGNAGNGGGIYLNCVSTNIVLNMTRTTMDNNLAGNGGNSGIDNAGTNTSPINGSNGGNGGAFEIISNNVSYLKLYIYESTFTNNRAGQGTDAQHNGINGLPGVGGVIHSKNFNYLTMNFCRIVDNTPQAFSMDLSTAYPISVLLQNNWWGSNANPVNQIAGNNSEKIAYTPWLILSVNVVPTSIYNGDTSTITANLIKNYPNGEDTSTYGMYVPDGTPVKFQTNAGTLNPTSSVTTKGVSSTIFTANVSGTDTVDTIVDHQSVPVSIQVNPWADVELTKVAPDNIVKGQEFTANVTAINNGPDRATNIVFNNPIPPQFKFISASTDKGTWFYDPTTTIFMWNIGNLEVGGIAHLYLTLKALQVGTYQIPSSIVSGTYDPNIENHNAPLIIQVTAPEEDMGNEVNENLVQAGNTIEMQKTGLPVAGLILAILMLLGGLAFSKRK